MLPLLFRICKKGISVWLGGLDVVVSAIGSEIRERLELISVYSLIKTNPTPWASALTTTMGFGSNVCYILKPKGSDSRSSSGLETLSNLKVVAMVARSLSQKEANSYRQAAAAKSKGSDSKTKAWRKRQRQQNKRKRQQRRFCYQQAAAIPQILR